MRSIRAVGLRHRGVKPLRGWVATSWRSRATTAMRFGRFTICRAVLLHAFQKKATRGATPKPEIDIRRRLRAAEKHYRENYGGGLIDED